MIHSVVGFLGAGNMAEALIRGLVETQICPPANLFASDANADRLAYIVRTYGVQAAADNLALVKQSSILILAVKPQQVSEVIQGLRGEWNPERQVLVSIAAGITTTFLEKALDVSARIIRVMPNTPAKLRAGASAFCLGQHAGPAERQLARTLFSAVGTVEETEESFLDAVTAVSGSGPAYVFHLCEMMIAAGIELGLTPDTAERLSIQTILGSARMLAESGQNPADLRQAVTSKGGTTEAALRHLESAGWEGVFSAALRAARDRARELTPPAPEW